VLARRTICNKEILRTLSRAAFSISQGSIAGRKRFRRIGTHVRVEVLPPERPGILRLAVEPVPGPVLLPEARSDDDSGGYSGDTSFIGSASGARPGGH
jgi:hypothetical protein